MQHAVCSVPSSAVRRCVERDLQYSDIPVPFSALRRLTTDFHIEMELAEKWVGLFRRHDDANPNSPPTPSPSSLTGGF